MAFELDTYHRNVADSDLIADLRNVASKLGKNSVTRDEQDANGAFHSCTIHRRFGSWFNALEKAGLKQTRTPMNLKEEELFSNLEVIWTKLGRQPRYQEIIKPFSNFSVGTYEKRFGTWRRALEAFVAYINDGTASESELLIGAQVLSQEATKRGPRKAGRKLVIQVLLRDKGICQFCKRNFTEGGSDYHIDHIIPWSKDGPTVLENLQLLCSKCNLIKGNLELSDEIEIEVQNDNI